MWDSTGNSIENPENIDRPAMFKLGDKSNSEFRNYIMKNIELPKEFSEVTISGKVIIQFCIDTDGNLINVKLKKGIHELLDKEVLRVICLQKKWIPGIHHNRPIRVKYSMPINIMIQ
jgi:protein TonB